MPASSTWSATAPIILYSVNTTTGVATRVGSATNFGINETAPGWIGFAQWHPVPVGALYVGYRRSMPATGVATVMFLTTVTRVGPDAGLAARAWRRMEATPLHAGRYAAGAVLQPQSGNRLRRQGWDAADAFGVGENWTREGWHPSTSSLLDGRQHARRAPTNCRCRPLGVWRNILSLSGSRGRGSVVWLQRHLAIQGAIVAPSSRKLQFDGRQVADGHSCPECQCQTLLPVAGNGRQCRPTYPARIVATKLTGGVVERSFTQQDGSFAGPSLAAVRHDL